MGGAAKATTEIKGVDAAADRVDGRDIDLDVDKDGSASAGIGNISGGFKSLASNIRATGTVLTASAIPFGIAAIGAATPALLAVGASAAGLALNLGRAAAGFGLVAAAAGGGALVGLKAYAALLSSVVRDTREAWTATHEHAAELLEQRRQHILGTRAANAFNEELNRQIIGLTKLEAAVGREVFPIFTREMRAWGGVLRANQGAIVDTATSIANVAAGFAKWFRTTDDGRVFGRTLEFINGSAMRAAQTIALIARVGISGLQPLIPLAVELQSHILGIAQVTTRWVESAEGQNRLGQIYRALWSDTKRLWEITKDLSVAVFNVFSALDRTGVADQATRGFAALASALRSATRAGGGLDRFLRATRQLMPFVGGAALKLVGAIGEVASAAIKARQEGHRLTVLQEIFRGIGRTARPLRNLVVGTFEDLGPEIAKLLPRLTRFFGIFAGSSGPLVSFVRTINRALQIFNNLPGPIKRTVGNLVALRLILGGLGLGAVVGALGRFASNSIIAAHAAKRVEIATGGAAAATVVAGGKFSRLRGIIARLGAAFFGVIKFLRFGGPWAIAIAAAVTAGVLLYRNWGKIVRAARPLTDTLHNIIRAVMPMVRVFGRALVDALRSVARGFLSAIDPSIKLKNATQSLAGFLQRLANRVLPVVARAVRDFDGWVRRNRDTLQSIGRVIGTVVVTGFRIWLGVVRASIAVVRGLVGAIRVGIGIFRTLVGAVSSAARAIGGAFGEAVRLVKARIEDIKDAWRALPDWLKSAGKDAAWGFIKGFTGVEIAKALGEKIKNVIDWIKKDNDGHSPWGSTAVLGRDAARGFAKGWLDSLSTGVLQRMADSVSNLWKRVRVNNELESRNAFRLPDLRGNLPRRVSQWDMGDPRDAVRNILNSQASSLGRNYARYLAFHANRLPDEFRNRHRDDFRRLAPRLQKLGFTTAEDFSIMNTAQMLRRAHISREAYRRQIRNQGGPWWQQDGGGTHRGGWQRARGGGSGGGSGGGMSSGEHRANLKGHTRELAGLMIAAMKDAPNLRAFQKTLDASLGGYLGFRNGMGVEPQ